MAITASENSALINQLTSRAVPGAVDVIGTATVTVKAQAGKPKGSHLEAKG
jgi:hypothetical protein